MDHLGKPKLITRKEALSRGLKCYFSGSPCPKGHVEPRFVSNRHCRRCLIERAAKANKERPHLQRVRMQRYRKKYQDRVGEATARSRARWSRDWDNRDALAAYYWLAQSLTRRTKVKHQVDHYYPLKGENFCGLHVISNLQILPRRDNVRKSNKNPEINALPEQAPSDYIHEPHLWEDRWPRAN